MRRKTIVLALVAGAVALATGIAYATIPNDGVIHGCYAKSGGAPRVIDVDVTTCARGFIGRGRQKAHDKRVSKANAASHVARARALIRRIPPSSFARGKRALVTRTASAAARAAKRKKACPALVAVDRLMNLLESPLTWRGRKIPARTQKPTSLLRRAGHELLLRAGARCAREPKEKRIAGRTATNGDFRRVRPPEAENEQGEGVLRPLRHGRLHVPKKRGRALEPEDPAPPRMLRNLGNSTPASTTHRTIDPLNFFRISDVAPTTGTGPVEPTAAIGHNVVWYTGNTSVALSTDAGRTFTSFSPSNVLPDDGRAFCCDQLVSYSPYVNLFVWVSQYWCRTSCLTTDSAGNTICPPASQPNGSNRIRIAVATPEELIANASNPSRAWTHWDITPQLLGQPANASFDRSDLAVNGRNMNWTVDVLCGNGSSVLGRIPLAELARRSTVNLSWITDIPQRMQAAQGPSASTTYFTGNSSDSRARIWSWAAFSNTLFLHEIDHSSVPANDFSVNGTDNSDWYGRYGIFPGAVESAAVSGNTLYLAQGTGRKLCTANCSSRTPTLRSIFPRPAVLITRYDVANWRLLNERWLYNPTLALTWPALSTNGGGEVGIVLHSADNGHNARPIAGFLTPEEQFTFGLTEGLPYTTGDYYSLRPGRTPFSFAMTAEKVTNDPAGRRLHWLFLEYGHGRSP